MILSITVSLLGTNAASSNPPSNGVSYNKNGQVTIENALDNLYNKTNYGDAKASDILKGKKALVGGKEVVGTYTIPTLASLTPGNAIASNIEEGKIAWVNGRKIVGTKRHDSLAYLRVGDYISYTPSNTSYTIPGARDQYGFSQRIQPSDLKLWRMIRRTVDGVIELVSVNVGIKHENHDQIYIWGNEGYLDYIKILNDAAKGYETEGYTIGSRHMGWDGKAIEHLTRMPAISSPEYGKAGVYGSPDDGYKTDVKLVGDIGALDVGEAYYLASRSTAVEITRQPYWEGFYNGSVFTTGCMYPIGHKEVGEYSVKICEIKSYDEGCTSSSGDPCNSNGIQAYIRPIVYLNPNLKITGGDGTESNPYTIGI